MHSRIRTVVGALAVAAFVAVAASMLTVHAQMPQSFRLRPSGSFRVVISAGNPAVTLPSLATFAADGGIVGTAIPLSCLDPGQQMGQMHGQWHVRIERGMPVLQFHLVSDIYQRPPNPNAEVSPNDVTGEPVETSYVGSLDIFGTSPITVGGIKGEGSINFPAGHRCAARYNGPVAFTAEELPAVQKTR
jgi:hypothetical protein